jgi:hypothetical protein
MSQVVSIRFDVQGNEKLLGMLTAYKSGIAGLEVEMIGLQTTLAKPMGGLGPLQNLAAGTEQATAKVASFKGQLASIGSQLGQNATSFGVATASVWGIYNAYDGLEKIQIRAHASGVKVQTLETSLAALTERRRIAVEKGNLTGEQMSILNEKIANTQEKLTVAQERNADATQDLQEAWAGFFSTIGPQVIAAGGSISQLFTSLTTKGPEGISALTKLKTSFAGLFASIAGAGAGGIKAIPEMFTKLKTAITGTTPALGPLDNAMKGTAGSTGFLSSSIGGFAVAAGAGAIAALGIIEAINQVQDTMDAAGLKFAKTRFGSFDIKQMQLGFDQLDTALKIFEAHGEKTSVAWLGAFPAEALAKLKAWGVQINETTGEIIPLASSVSELGAGFSATKEEYIEWATNILKAGGTAGKVFDYLKKSKIDDAHSTEIQLAANTAYQASLDALGITTEQYNAIGTEATAIIGLYIDRVKTGQVPVEALTGSIHGQVAAWVKSTGASEEEGKVLEDLIVKQLKTYNNYKATAVVIDQARVKRLQEAEAIKASAAAYLGLGAIQGKSVGQLEVFNDTLGKSIDAVVEQGLTLRKWADAEAMATDFTNDFVNAQFDYIESMIDVNKINDTSVDSLIKIRQAFVDGKLAAQDFVAQSKLQAIETEANQAALEDWARTWGLDLPNSMKLTVDQLHAVIDAENQTKTGTLELEKIMSEQLQPSFEHFGDIFTATSWKEFKSSWKELGKSGALQGIPKDLKSSLRDIGSDLIDVNKHAKEATNVIDALLVSAASDRQKGTKSGLKALLEDVKDIPGSDKIGPFKTALKELIDLPKDERTKALLNYTDAFAAYKDAVKPDSPGGTIITSGEAEKINNLTKAAQDGVGPLNSYAGAIDTLGKSAKSLSTIKLPNWVTDLSSGKASPFSNLQLGEAISGEASKIFNQPKAPATEITPPKPIVFPPPDISNITKAVATIEEDIGSINDFAANLVLVFPIPDTGGIILGIRKAEVDIGSMVDFAANLVLVFPPPNIEAIAASSSKAQEDIGAVEVFLEGLKDWAFPKPDVSQVTTAAIQANATIKTVQTFISGSAMKLEFQKPNIATITTAVGTANKAIASVEAAVKKLVLKFPKMDISEITKGVNAAQAKINSLKPKNVTNTVTTHYVDSGSKPKARGGVEYRETATNTTWGEGGPEVALFMPLTRAGQPRKGDYDITIPSPTLDTSGIRNALRDNRGGISEGRSVSSGPTTVNMTTEVYLFPGSDMFKKFVKSIMLEEMSRYPVV